MELEEKRKMESDITTVPYRWRRLQLEYLFEYFPLGQIIIFQLEGYINRQDIEARVEKFQERFLQRLPFPMKKFQTRRNVTKHSPENFGEYLEQLKNVFYEEPMGILYKIPEYQSLINLTLYVLNEIRKLEPYQGNEKVYILDANLITDGLIQWERTLNETLERYFIRDLQRRGFGARSFADALMLIVEYLLKNHEEIALSYLSQISISAVVSAEKQSNQNREQFLSRYVEELLQMLMGKPGSEYKILHVLEIIRR